MALDDPPPQGAGHRLRIGPGSGLPARCHPGLWLRGHPDQALQRSQKALPLARALARGWARAKQGAPEPGIAQRHQGVATLQALGSGGGRPSMRAQLAEDCLDMGRAEQGLSRAAEALAVARHTGQRWGEADPYRPQGAWLRAPSWEPHAEADARVRQAFVTHHQEAKSLEWRAAMSLARRWRRQGRCEGAR
jgi:predicted ATPase